MTACTKCGRDKPPSGFRPRRGACIDCEAAAERDRYTAKRGPKKPPVKAWTAARNAQLLGLIEKYGPNLQRKLIAIELGLAGGGEQMVMKRLRELRIEGQPL